MQCQPFQPGGLAGSGVWVVRFGHQGKTTSSKVVTSAGSDMEEQSLENGVASIFWFIMGCIMKKLLLCSLVFAASSVFASNCPVEMKAIDAKLGAMPALSEADMAKVKTLRADGEKFHKEGKHAESMKALAEAKKLLSM